MKTGRNETCPCGSGKKYKYCCWSKQTAALPSSFIKYNKKYNRYETAIDHHYASFNHQGVNLIGSKPYIGKIKCRLVHEVGNSIIIPDYIFIKNGWIQPLNFRAPFLNELDEEKIVCNINIDIQNGKTITVRFYNNKLIKFCSDKSQLFECEIYGLEDIEDYICGEYKTIDDEIYLKLFHHTNEVGFEGITSSKSLRPSIWNYLGSKKCVNHHFGYFTHIPEIKYSNDLITVAMSREGKIDYMIDSFIQPKVLPPNYREKFKKSIYTANVYRSTTLDRKQAISFLIPVESMDIKHIYMHHQGNLVFYEICFPYIHRIKVKANSVLLFNDNYVIEKDDSVINSDYSIIGDARIKEGLAAPFDEEDTKFIFKIEDCGKESIHDFWFSHSNKDLFTEKVIEKLELKDVDDNPTK
jgi:hypothetical protein